jgi:hypothetical protein
VHRTSPDYGRYLFTKIQRNQAYRPDPRARDVIGAHHSTSGCRPRPRRPRPPRSPPPSVAGSSTSTLHGYRRREQELKQIRDIEVPKAGDPAAPRPATSPGERRIARALERQEHLMRRIRS